MSKKTESIEFRLSPELKEDLAQRSAASGQTMSGYLRNLVSDDMTGGVSSAKGDPDMTTLFPKSVTRLSLMALPALLLAGGYMVSSGMVAQASPEVRLAFAEMDVNGDGKVTEAEYIAVFTGTDLGMPPLPAACKGTAVETEFNQPLEAVMREELQSIDANADKLISYDELSAFMMRDVAEMFLEADADGNGFVTQAEVIAVENAEPMNAEELAEAEAESGISSACIAALEAEDRTPFLTIELGGDEADLSDEAAARLFIAEYDENRDGRLSLDEVIAN